MKFVCDRCQTKYSIADEKVRGKILKVRCKACTNIITVREEAVAGGPRRPPSVAVPTVGSPAARAPAARPLAAPPAAPPAAPRPHAPPPAAPDDGVQWYMALDGNRSGPFTRKQLVDKVAPYSADADLHVWNELLGSWKPPGQVPAIAADLAARRPSGPPPFPGAPRRPTPSPPVPSLSASSPPRVTGAHAVAAAIGPGVGLKLPPPGGPPAGRRITGPVSRSAVMAAAAAMAPAPAHEHSQHSGHAERSDEGLDVDPSTLLETPAPQPHMLHGLGSNGFGGAHAADSAIPNGTSAAADRSDVLNTLNLAGAGAAGASPRLLSSEAIVGWQPGSAQASGARQRGGRLVLAFLAVIAVIVVVLFLNVTKKTRPPLAPAPKAVATDPMAGIAEKGVEPPPPVAPAPVEPVAPAPVIAPLPPAGHGKGKPVRGAHGHGPAPVAATSPGPAIATAAPVADANARYRDTSRPGLSITGGGGSSRPAPSQSDISRVINNNRGGIKNCYQRALLRDNSLTHGKITVQVTIGISGRVKRTSIDGPPQFRALDPCIKELVGRWAFPQAGDEYGTEFVYVFQGNE